MVDSNDENEIESILVKIEDVIDQESDIKCYVDQIREVMDRKNKETKS